MMRTTDQLRYILMILPVSSLLIGLFSSHSRDSDYSVLKLKFARPVLRLPQDVQRLVIPDPAIYNRLDQDIIQYEVVQQSGRAITVATVPEDATLVFTGAYAQLSGTNVICPPARGHGQPNTTPQASAGNEEHLGLISLLPEKWTNYRHIEC